MMKDTEAAEKAKGVYMYIRRGGTTPERALEVTKDELSYWGHTSAATLLSVTAMESELSAEGVGGGVGVDRTAEAAPTASHPVHHEPPGAQCYKCGGPVADGGSDCGEC